jgi:ribonuclease-3
VSEDGPEHAKSFQAEVHVGGSVLGRGAGRTKKVAEQEAAALAWESVRDAHEAPDAGGSTQHGA